jgi:hypothetical protein
LAFSIAEMQASRSSIVACRTRAMGLPVDGETEVRKSPAPRQEAPS